MLIIKSEIFKIVSWYNLYKLKCLKKNILNKRLNNTSGKQILVFIIIKALYCL